MDHKTALRLARACIDPNADRVEVRNRARLWSGFGRVYEVSCPSSSSSSWSDRTGMIVKYIEPKLSSKPSIGDRRKLDSYQVEANFYEFHAHDLFAKHGIGLPLPLLVERQDNSSDNRNSRNNNNHRVIICMGKLDDINDHDDDEDNTADDDDTDLPTIDQKVMLWLANFHAATWQKNDVENYCLQPVGSFWHLDTRQEEWDRMSDDGWEGRLKRAARAIDQRLKRDPMQCWIHGDAKNDNIMSLQRVSQDEDNNRNNRNNSNNQKKGSARNTTRRHQEIAFCDFQYVGRGPPSKDLAYFLCSSHTVNKHEENVLIDIYFKQLCNRLEELGFPHPLPSRRELDDSLELAYCDFCRFMSGWGFWGLDISKRVQKCLDRLDGGTILGSEDDYHEAIRREFG